MVVNEEVPPPMEYDQEEIQSNRNSEQVLLFHLDEDPYEKKNLATEYPAITQYLAGLLDQYQVTFLLMLLAQLVSSKAGMVAPDIAPRLDEGNPINFKGVWSPGWCNASMYKTVP